VTGRSSAAPLPEDQWQRPLSRCWPCTALHTGRRFRKEAQRLASEALRSKPNYVLDAIRKTSFGGRGLRLSAQTLLSQPELKVPLTERTPMPAARFWRRGWRGGLPERVKRSPRPGPAHPDVICRLAPSAPRHQTRMAEGARFCRLLCIRDGSAPTRRRHEA